MPSTIDYELVSPVRIADGKGDYEQLTRLVVRAPHNDVLNHVVAVRQLVTQGMSEARLSIFDPGPAAEVEREIAEEQARTEGEFEQQGLDPAAANPYRDDEKPNDLEGKREEHEPDLAGPIVLLASTSISLPDLFANLHAVMITPGNCLLNGARDMTPAVWKKLSFEDTQRLFGEYVSSFFLS